MSIMGKTKFKRGKRHVNCGKLASNQLRTDRHALVTMSGDPFIDDTDTKFGGKPAIQRNDNFVFLAENGLLISFVGGCCHIMNT